MDDLTVDAGLFAPPTFDGFSDYSAGLVDFTPAFSADPLPLELTPAPALQAAEVPAPRVEETAPPVPSQDAPQAPAPQSNIVSMFVSEAAAAPILPEDAMPKAAPLPELPKPAVDFAPADVAKQRVLPDDTAVSSHRVRRILASPVGSIVSEVAQSMGYDRDRLAAFVDIESSGRPRISTGSYHGLGQLSHSEFAKFGDGGDIFDPRSNLIATVRSLQAKEAKFASEFGRSPSVTEIYMMHQQGEAGLRSHLAHPDWPAWKSMLATGEGKQKGETWARNAIWWNVPTDMKAKFGSVDNVTSGDFLSMWDSKVRGTQFTAGAQVAPALPQNSGTIPGVVPGSVEEAAMSKPVLVDARRQSAFATQLQPSDINAPPLPPSELAVQAENRKAAEYASSHSVVTEAFQQSNLTVRAAQLFMGGQFAPDYSFSLTPEVQSDLMKRYGLAEEYRSSLTSAVSEQHAEHLASLAQAEQQRTAYLASQGLTGIGANLFAAFADPVAITAGAATGGLADAAAVLANAGRTGRVVAQAVGGAASNVGLAYAARELGDPMATQEIGLAAAMGAIFGSSYGLISRNPATIEEAVMLRKAGMTVKKALEDSTALTEPATAAKSAGAAANPNVNEVALNNAAINAVNDINTPYTAFSKGLFGVIPVRFSAAYQAKSSKSAFERLLGGMGLDAVGWKDKSVNEFSPAEAAQLAVDQHMHRVHQVWAPSAREFYQDMERTLGEKVFGSSQFNEQVYRYVVNTDPSVEFHPAVKRVGDRIAELNAEILKLAKNPAHRKGLVSRAVQGFENVEENRHYMTRVYAQDKINALRDANNPNGVGDTGIMAWTRGAIRKAQPDLDDDEIEKLARWHALRITRRANGVDEQLNFALSGFDRDQLKEVFSEAGIEDSRIERLLNRVGKDDKVGAGARAKRRLFLDETYVLRDFPTYGGGARDIALTDMVVTDAAVLTHVYAKHMYGRIALADWKVKNPQTGELLVNGITGDNDFTAVLNRLAQYNADHLNPMEAKAITEKGKANLQYMYDSILGRPDPDATGTAARFLHRWGDVNYIRLGGNFGMAQIPEVAMPIAHLTTRSMMHIMPAFRRIVQGGEEVLKDGFARTVEAMWGMPSDAFRGFANIRHEETGAAPVGIGSKVDRGLAFAKDAVGHVSGLNFVNAALQRWTGKAIIQRFSDMALKAATGANGAIDLTQIKPAHLARMRNLGLSDDMLKRVLKEIKENVTLEDGLLFKHKVARLNMEGWKDQEARSSFEAAGFRLARNVIQTNDIGTMHRWMAKPLARALMQFRIFPLVAWEKQLMHNVHMADMQTFNVMWMSMATGAITYAAQTHLAATGRSDRDKWLRDRLSTGKIAAGAFQRAGWSSLLPTLWDTGAYMVGGKPAFDFRTSGQPSDAIFGNTYMSTIDDIAKASKGLVQPLINGRERSQQEYRSIARVAPLATWLPWTGLLSTMISGQPLYAPKDQK